MSYDLFSALTLLDECQKGQPTCKNHFIPSRRKASNPGSPEKWSLEWLYAFCLSNVTKLDCCCVCTEVVIAGILWRLGCQGWLPTTSQRHRHAFHKWSEARALLTNIGSSVTASGAFKLRQNKQLVIATFVSGSKVHVGKTTDYLWISVRNGLSFVRFRRLSLYAAVDVGSFVFHFSCLHCTVDVSPECLVTVCSLTGRTFGL